MTLLVGRQSEGAGAEISISKKAYGWRFECTVTGTVEELEVKLPVAYTGKYRLGVFNDGTESKQPGAATTGTNEKEAEVTAQTVLTTTGLSVKVTKGAFYWLAWDVIGGTFKIKREATGHSNSAKSEEPANPTTIAGVTKWAQETTGPMYIAALGTEEGGFVATAPKFEFATELKVSATGGSGSVTTVPVFSFATEVETEVQQAGGTQNVYYGPASEKAAEEAVKNVAATKHFCRFLDIWPAASAGAATVIVVHGGGWCGGNKNEKESVPKQLNERGYLAFNIDYRRATETIGAWESNPVEEIKDVEEAITYARAHAEEFNGNPNNIFVLGGSSGGELGSEAARKMNASGVKVKGVICMSSIYSLRPFVKEMEEGTYFETEGGHDGGSANELIEHMQFALQQTLEGGHAGAPIIAGKTKTNVAGSITKQELVSPTVQTVPAAACRWFLLSYEKDLIPAGQQVGFEAHLQTEKRPIQTTILAGKTGHGFSMWGNPAVRTEVFEFIEAAQAGPIVEMSLEVKATFVGVTPGGGGTSRSPFLEIATGGKHSKFRTRT